MTERPYLVDHEVSRRAYAALGVLAAINLLNYLDRYALSAVLPWVEASFSLDDRQSGLLGSVFMLVHLAASPFAGYLGDRSRRKYLVAGGVFLWSLATIGSGLVSGYGGLLLMRALVGIGEAGYATVAPGMIADLFVERRRGRMLAYFYMAIPVGTALGYLIGGTVAEELGWRWAFVVAGAPGIAATLVALMMREPERGASDRASAAIPPPGVGGDAPVGSPVERPLETPPANPVESSPESPYESSIEPRVESTPPPPPSARAAWARVASSPVWWYDTLGTALITFTLGGLAFWMPTFLMRVHSASGESMGVQLGVVLLLAGLIATPIGGRLGDLVSARRQGGHLEVSAAALVASVPLIGALPFVPDLRTTLVLSFLALFLLGLTIGPINAVLVSCVPPSVRSTAVALNLILVHLFGDAMSPWLIGWLSDATDLRVAIALSSVPVGLGAAVLAYGARQVNRRGEGLAYVRRRAG